MKYNELLAMLPKLNRQQLMAVKARVELLMQTSQPDRVASKPRQDDWLLEGVLDELHRRGVKVPPPHVAINDAPNYKAQSEAVRNHLVSKVGKSMRAAEEYALGRAAARALGSWLEARNIALSARSMLRNIDRTSEAVESSFPGYQAAAALRFLCRGD